MSHTQMLFNYAEVRMPLGLTLLMLFVISSPLFSLNSESPAGRPLVVLAAEAQDHRIVYHVDGRDAKPDLLRVLNLVGDQRGREIKVIVMIDSRAPISEIGNIDGTLGKAGFTKVRFFVFNKEANVMSTLQFGRTIPFSLHPLWD